MSAGDGLTGGGTFTANQSGNTTRTVNVGAGSYIIVAADTVSVDATNANTASKVVARDGSGDFSAGTITATLSGSASSLTTARDIGGVSFNGTANINLPGVNIGGNQDTTGNAASATTAGAMTGNMSSAGRAYLWNVDDNANHPVLFTEPNNSAGNYKIYKDDALNFYYNASSNIVYATDFIASSDERQKDVIEPITGALEKVCAIDGFIYKWNDKASSKDTVTRQVGVSAQQIQEVLPEIVAFIPSGDNIIVPRIFLLTKYF